MLKIVKKQEDTDMKVCGQKNEVTLLIHGRERTFSEKELVDILEKQIPIETTKQVTSLKLALPPTENKWFQVNPQTIDQELFKDKRQDLKQEQTRQLIVEAFVEVANNPVRYCRTFYTMMPKKKWLSKTVAELKKMACRLGDHNADWVEQALEWAQRIANGDSWEAICNNDDTANWYRIVVWKNGYARLIGGSANSYTVFPASQIGNYNHYDDSSLVDTVPSVVHYK